MKGASARAGWAALLVAGLAACDRGAPGAAAQGPEVPPLARRQGEGGSGGSVPCSTPECPDGACARGTICGGLPVCDKSDGGVCDCSDPRCLPAPPYCTGDDDCPYGECVKPKGRCYCDDDSDCGGSSRFFCGEASTCEALPVPRCRSDADCCGDGDAGACGSCSPEGVCSAPITAGPDPTLTCGVRGGAGAAAGALACAGAACALACAGAAMARRRRRRQKEAATESWGTQSRNGP